MRACLVSLLGLTCVLGCSSSSAGGDGEDGSGETGPTTASTGTSATLSSGPTTDGTTTTDDTTDTGIKLDVGVDTDGLPGGNPPPFPTTCAESLESKTSVGCTFYPLNVPGSGGPTAAFIVSNVSDQMANVTLSDRNGQLAQAQVAPGALHSFDGALHDMGPQLNGPWTGTFDKGYVIESDQVLQVWTFMPTQIAATNDASIIFPAPALGTKHRIISYNDKFTSATVPTHYVAVVATEDDTDVTFTLAPDGSYTDAGGGIPALDKDNGPDTTTTNIDRLQVVLITGWNRNPNTMEFDNHFTGSLVESTKPVAVYSGNTCSFAPDCGTTDCCCCDLITDAVPPTTVYGTEYAGVKLLPLKDDEDIWRFIGNKDGTVITLEGGVNQVINLDAGEHQDVITQEVFWVSATEPIGLVHFMTSGTAAGFWPPEEPLQTYDCENPLSAPGDPAITWVYPWGNWLHRYQFPVGQATFGQWCHDHITVTAPLLAWDMITLNGAMLPAPTEIAQKGVGYAYVQVPDGDYELLAPDDVGVEVSVYGYSHHGSYLYPGGMGLQDLNPEG